MCLQRKKPSGLPYNSMPEIRHCTEIPEVAVPHVPDRKMLEEMVREILAALSAEPQPKADLDGSKCKHTEIDIAANELLDEEGISALLGSLAAIQGL